MALMSQAEFARQQGFTKAYVTKLIKKGIVKLNNGKVDSAQAEQAMKANADPVPLTVPIKPLSLHQHNQEPLTLLPLGLCGKPSKQKWPSWNMKKKAAL